MSKLAKGLELIDAHIEEHWNFMKKCHLYNIDISPVFFDYLKELNEIRELVAINLSLKHDDPS